MALAQSHENLAAAAERFEESQERSSQLLGGLRGWLDRFTGTARPEDINPIAAMLPEPGVEGEVVALMTDCQVHRRTRIKYRCLLCLTESLGHVFNLMSNRLKGIERMNT